MHYYYFSKYCIGFLLCLCAAKDMCMFNVLFQDLNGRTSYVYFFMCGCVCMSGPPAPREPLVPGGTANE